MLPVGKMDDNGEDDDDGEDEDKSDCDAFDAFPSAWIAISAALLAAALAISEALPAVKGTVSASRPPLVLAKSLI